MITNQETFRTLLLGHIPKDKWIHITDIYDNVERNIGEFQENDFDPLAEYNQQPRWKRNIRNALQTLKLTKQIIWNGDSNYLFPSDVSDDIESTSFPVRQGLSENQFLILQERRREIGRQGEEYVVDFERKKLVEAGKTDLAKRVRRVSISDIGAGFDVLSFTPQGEQIYIEVKTTIGNGFSFEITINELNKSEIYKQNYFIYFIRNFNPGDDKTDLRIISGIEIQKILALEPSSFKATLIRR